MVYLSSHTFGHTYKIYVVVYLFFFFLLLFFLIVYNYKYKFPCLSKYVIFLTKQFLHFTFSYTNTLFNFFL